MLNVLFHVPSFYVNWQGRNHQLTVPIKREKPHRSPGTFSDQFPWTNQKGCATSRWKISNPIHQIGVGLTIFIWLVVSTPLENISQNRNLPQIGVKIKHIWNHRPVHISFKGFVCKQFLELSQKKSHDLRKNPSNNPNKKNINSSENYRMTSWKKSNHKWICMWFYIDLPASHCQFSGICKKSNSTCTSSSLFFFLQVSLGFSSFFSDRAFPWSSATPSSKSFHPRAQDGKFPGWNYQPRPEPVVRNGVVNLSHMGNWG